MNNVNDYKPIPVTEAKALAERYQKSIVIVFAHDPVFGLLHTTTYGVSEQEKDWAAKGGEIATTALGGIVPLQISYEDYRVTRIKQLEDTRAALLAALKTAQYGIDGLCPECAYDHHHEHSASCSLAKAIAKAEAE